MKAMDPHSNLAHEGFIYPAEALSRELEELVEERVRRVVWDVRNEVARAILGLILEHKNPSLTAAAIAYAAGMEINGGLSQVQIAQKFGVTKQAFSRRVTEISKHLSLNPSRGMRSVDSRETFKEKQLCRKKSKLHLAIASLK